MTAPIDDGRSPENRPYWKAALQGALLYKQCRDCGRLHHYPRVHCPFCGSSKTAWLQSSGRGVVYSFSVVRRAAVPYVVAYVTLDEGFTMLTNIVDCGVDELSVGQAVAVIFVDSEPGHPVPMFSPV